LKQDTAAREENWGFWQPFEGINVTTNGDEYTSFINHFRGYGSSFSDNIAFDNGSGMSLFNMSLFNNFAGAWRSRYMRERTEVWYKSPEAFAVM
jgi:hypothetical protein